jgi:chromosome partitioning protein
VGKAENPGDYVPLSEIIVKTISGIDLVPSHLDLVGAEPVLYSYPDRFAILADEIAAIKERYDHIFIDTPPFLGQFLLNGIYAADKVAIIFSPDGFALQGYDNIRLILKDMEEVLKKRISLDLAILNRWSDPEIRKGLLDRIGLMFRKDTKPADPLEELKSQIKELVAHDISPVFEVPDSRMVSVANKRGLLLELLAPGDPAGKAFATIADYIDTEW